jgi:hypothetical protein
MIQEDHLITDPADPDPFHCQNPCRLQANHSVLFQYNFLISEERCWRSDLSIRGDNGGPPHQDQTQKIQERVQKFLRIFFYIIFDFSNTVAV